MNHFYPAIASVRIVVLWVLLISIGECTLSVRSKAQQLRSADDNEILARIGPRTITVRDFLERIDLMPWPDKDKPAARDSAKIRALVSLVAEKLMSMKAADEGFAQNPKTSSSLKALERLMARDELYRMDVMSKISVQPEAVTVGLQRYALTLKLNTFVMDSKENAERLAELLNSQSANIRNPLSTEGIISHDTISINFGDLMPEYEEAVYALDSPGKARAAYASESGWTVFQALDKSTNANFAKESIRDRQATVQRKLKRREEQHFATLYLNQLFTHPVAMDSVMFRILADTLLAIMRTDSAGHRQEGFFGIRADDVENVRVALAPQLSTPFITMGGYAVSVEEIIHELKFFPVRFKSLRRNSFFKTLNQNIQPIAEAALLSQEALRRRLNERPEVRRDLNVWVDAMQADRLLKYLLDSLGRAYDSVQFDGSDTLFTTVGRVESKAIETINRYLSGLANAYGVEINFAKLKRVDISPSNIVTRRFIGFGGSMMATPMLLRLWEWLETWKRSQQISP